MSKMMKRVRSWTLAATLLLPVAVGAPFESVRADGFERSYEGRFLFFGDSLSDNGNFYALSAGIAPRDPYYKGRFSNGPVWTEQLVGEDNVGRIMHTRAFDWDHVDFAFGAAGSKESFLRPNVGNQVAVLEGALDGGRTEIRPDDIAIIWSGANDFFEAFFLDIMPNPETADEVLTRVVQTSVFGIADAILRLRQVGLSRIFVMDLPDLGRTPALLEDPLFQDIGHDATTRFNAQLRDQVALLQPVVAGDILEVIDVNTTFIEELENPEEYGFDNVTEACWDIEKGLCSEKREEQDKYGFFDGIHPTAAVHYFIADLVNEQLEAFLPARDDVGVRQAFERDQQRGLKQMQRQSLRPLQP